MFNSSLQTAISGQYDDTSMEGGMVAGGASNT